MHNVHKLAAVSATAGWWHTSCCVSVCGRVNYSWVKEDQSRILASREGCRSNGKQAEKPGATVILPHFGGIFSNWKLKCTATSNKLKYFFFVCVTKVRLFNTAWSCSHCNNWLINTFDLVRRIIGMGARGGNNCKPVKQERLNMDPWSNCSVLSLLIVWKVIVLHCSRLRFVSFQLS